MRVSGHNENNYHKKCDKIALFLCSKNKRGYFRGGTLSEENAQKKGERACSLRLFSEYFPEDGLSAEIAMAISKRKAPRAK